MSHDFRLALLQNFISDGLTVDEMVKKAELLADILEAGVLSKQAASPVAAASPIEGAAAGVLGFLSDRLGRGSDNLISGATQIAGNLAPMALAGSVALPIAAGYYGGNMLANVTDPGEERLVEMKKREQIAELRAQTARLRQRRRARSLNA